VPGKGGNILPPREAHKRKKPEKKNSKTKNPLNGGKNLVWEVPESLMITVKIANAKTDTIERVRIKKE